MKSEIYWIKEEVIASGKLGTMARPRGNDWLEDEIKWLKTQDVHIVVSMLENSESYELGLQKEADLCKTHGIDFINFPIIDIHTPNNESQFVELISSLNASIKKGKHVVAHCRMGIGRSSLVAAGVLIQNGLNADNVFSTISEYRKLKVPDTKEQEEWMKSMENKIRLR